MVNLVSSENRENTKWFVLSPLLENFLCQADDVANKSTRIKMLFFTVVDRRIGTNKNIAAARIVCVHHFIEESLFIQGLATTLNTVFGEDATRIHIVVPNTKGL